MRLNPTMHSPQGIPIFVYLLLFIYNTDKTSVIQFNNHDT